MIYRVYESGGVKEYWGFDSDLEWDSLCPFPEMKPLGCKPVSASELPFYWAGGIWLCLNDEIKVKGTELNYDGAKTAESILRLGSAVSPVIVRNFDCDGRQIRFLDKLAGINKAIILYPRKGYPVPPVPHFVNIILPENEMK